MPRLRPCRFEGCPSSAMDGYYRCEKHQKLFWRRETKERQLNGTIDGFYKTRAWRRLRLLQLSHFPICNDCKTQAATMVDHIKPISQGGELMNQDNLQSMCESCHARKRQREAWESKKGEGIV